MEKIFIVTVKVNDKSTDGNKIKFESVIDMKLSDFIEIEKEYIKDVVALGLSGLFAFKGIGFENSKAKQMFEFMINSGIRSGIRHYESKDLSYFEEVTKVADSVRGKMDEDFNRSIDVVNK